jgi:type VI secretion system Hcp family effector
MSFIKLKIEGIDAEGEDSTIPVVAMAHKVIMPMNEPNASSSSAGMRTSGAAKHGVIELGIGTTIALPKLYDALHGAKSLGVVTITASRMNNDKMEPYMVYALENVFVHYIEMSSKTEGDNVVPFYKVALDYTGIKLNVTSFDDQGVSKGTVEASLQRKK